MKNCGWMNDNNVRKIVAVENANESNDQKSPLGSLFLMANNYEITKKGDFSRSGWATQWARRAFHLSFSFRPNKEFQHLKRLLRFRYFDCFVEKHRISLEPNDKTFNKLIINKFEFSRRRKSERQCVIFVKGFLYFFFFSWSTRLCTWVKWLIVGYESVRNYAMLMSSLTFLTQTKLTLV